MMDTKIMMNESYKKNGKGRIVCETLRPIVVRQSAWKNYSLNLSSKNFGHFTGIIIIQVLDSL